jgi:hypothetical protein
LKTIVLLVEDSKLQRLKNELILHRAGYAVLSAEDPRSSSPEIGWQRGVERAEKRSSTADIPVIALSSLPQINESKLRKAGAAAYIEKSRLVEVGGEKEFMEIVERVIQETKDRRAANAGSANQG